MNFSNFFGRAQKSGRPKGARNSKYHQAGGARKGVGRKKKDRAANTRKLVEFATNARDSTNQLNENEPTMRGNTMSNDANTKAATESELNNIAAPAQERDINWDEILIRLRDTYGNVDSKGCADDDVSESSESSSDFEWDEEDDAT